MDRGIAEDGVELGIEGKPLALGDARVEAQAAGGLDLGCACVDADDVASELDELFGQSAVAALNCLVFNTFQNNGGSPSNKIELPP